MPLDPTSFEKHPSGLDVPSGFTQQQQAAAASVTPSAESGDPPQGLNLGQRRAWADQRLANNQSLNKRQMVGAKVRNHVANAAANQQVFEQFRRAGMGAAIRFAIGAPAMPANVLPYARAAAITRAEGQPPEPLYGESSQEGDGDGGEGD